MTAGDETRNRTLCRARRLFFLVALILLSALSPQAEGARGRTVLVWISLDGVRGDYVDRANTPFLDRLMSEGAYTRELMPVFPSLTFPNHVSQATGVTVDQHGIPLNAFYDTKHYRNYRYPSDPRLLKAEPIWITAKRQGIRTAVTDWVLSHAQTGPVSADYFGEKYDTSLGDRERIQVLLDIWKKDTKAKPLQLLMGYADGPDKAGHAYGPDAPEIAVTMSEMDQLMRDALDQVMGLFTNRMAKNDTLYVFITTDHGMAKVHTLVNPTLLTGVNDQTNVILVTSGNMAHIHLNLIRDARRRAALADAIMARLQPREFLRAYRRKDLPKEWRYDYPRRVGDIVIALETGYTFSSRPTAVTAPIEEFGEPKGMHGYDPEREPLMKGFAVFWRYPEKLGGVNLGPVHCLQLHPTAAAVLGIQPAEGATAKPISFSTQ